MVTEHHAGGTYDGRQEGREEPRVEIYNVEQRRLIDAEITRRSVAFIEKQAKSGKPFFAYVALTQPHLPTEPNPSFKGKTSNGDWADMLAEMDANVGQMLDAVDKAGVRDNTIVIFTSDNGPEFFKPWDGWAGPWRGQYFTALEGGIRVPFLIRWPGKIAAQRVSNEIVHGVDMFAPGETAGQSAHGPAVRQPRPVGFFLGKPEVGARGFPIFCAERLQA
jgi:arylsulfatase